MHIPVATYRLQLNSAFGFKETKNLLPYLAALGISDIYAAPIFKARKGSTHGYDIVDPNQLNPELGGMKEFDELIRAAKEFQLHWLQDIVPNHMAFDSENALLMDVLEYGEQSKYFDFLDIDWNHPYGDLKGRVLAPFLGKVYGECLEDGEIQLRYDQGVFTVNYYDLKFPVRIDSYAQIFEYNLESLEGRFAGDQPVFTKFLGALRYLKALSSSKKDEGRGYQVKHAKRMLWNLYNENTVIQQFINENIASYNGKKGDSESFNALDKLISEQFFRLSFWKVASEEINYRRFFVINDLISLRVEDERVFQHTHNLIISLVKKGTFNGLRVDHIDGLYDPLTYLRRLRGKVGELYLVVEKILESSEQLPTSWSVQGTTGYDFLNLANGVFCCRENGKTFSKIYLNFTNIDTPYADLLCDKKRTIIGKYLAGNIDNLAQFMKKSSSKDRYGRDITLYGLRRALVEVMANFSVYRTYINYDSCSDSDQSYIKEAIQKAKERSPGLLYDLNYIEKLLLLDYDSSLTEEDKRECVQFAMYLQQYTGPLMAKGFEDTFLYIYNRLISLNEVGGNPIFFGCSAEEFHDFNRKRAALFPHSLNATSTHDTKRGEDVRARINVLSELPKEWEDHLKTWSKINKDKKRKIEDKYAPDENDEYFLYQTLIGAFPFSDKEQSFTERMQNYIVKAVREAKVHTGWIRPDVEYEDACVSFVKDILMPSPDNRFLLEFLPVQKKIAYYGIFNSLSQVLIKVTSPGVPDFYQGTELWDLNLVDPDNRRLVDFEKRGRFLQDIMNKEKRDCLGLIKELLATKEDGRIKLFLIYRALKARKEKLDVFEKGTYLPLRAEGRFKNCLVVYARTYEGTWIITIATRFFTPLIKEGEYPLGDNVWKDTCVELPEHAPSCWEEVITEQTIQVQSSFGVGGVLKYFPVALLMSKEVKHERL